MMEFRAWKKHSLPLMSTFIEKRFLYLFLMVFSPFHHICLLPGALFSYPYEQLSSSGAHGCHYFLSLISGYPSLVPPLPSMGNSFLVMYHPSLSLSLFYHSSLSYKFPCLRGPIPILNFLYPH